MKFHGGVWGGNRSKGLDFGSDPDHDPDPRFFKGFLAIVG